MHISM